MKDINKYFYLTVLFALVGVQVVCAGETFQNNLLKMDVYKSSLGGVKVTLYTSKPYSDSVTVNKKGDNEYVILMPETSNSMTAKPTLKSVSDKVKSVDVRTQQYQNQVKGYTKIVISTHGATEITPQVQTLATSDYRVSEKDYKELLSQINKKKSQPSKKAVTSGVKTAQSSNKNVAPRPTSRPVAHPVSKPAGIKISTPVFVQKTMQKLAPQKNISQKLSQKTVKPAASKDVAKTIKSQKVAEQPKQAETQNVQPTAPNGKDVVTPRIAQQAEDKIAPAVQAPKPVNEASVPAAQSPSFLHKIKTVVKNNVYPALGMVFALFMILLLGARKMTQNFKKQKELFASHLDEKPFTATDYTEKINDNMTWKEKYQTYVDAKESQNMPDENPQEKADSHGNPDLDDLFGSESSYDESETADIFEENEFESSETEKGEDLTEKIEIPSENGFDNELNNQGVLQSEEGFAPEDYEELSNIDEENEVSIDELFGEDDLFDAPFDEDAILEEDQAESAEIAEEESEDNLVKSEFSIDSDKGFYLVDFEDTTALVGHIDDEIFVLKRFSKKINAPIQARLNERKLNSVSFMTKVGSFRGVVEVTPEKMNLLIEL